MDWSINITAATIATAVIAFILTLLLSTEYISNTVFLLVKHFFGLNRQCSMRNYAYNWQSVIARNKLFVTKNIKKDKYLNQGDLATAANYVKGVEHEKDYVTISNYIKQLKKL